MNKGSTSFRELLLIDLKQSLNRSNQYIQCGGDTQLKKTRYRRDRVLSRLIDLEIKKCAVNILQIAFID